MRSLIRMAIWQTQFLAAVPSHRTNDVILIDPSDVAFPVGFNPLDVDPAMVDVACDGIVSTFRKVFGTGTHTPRLEDILWKHGFGFDASRGLYDS